MAYRIFNFIPVAGAIARLFFPYIEVVVNDIRDKTIKHIANPFSGRTLGEPSLLELALEVPCGITRSRDRETVSEVSFRKDWRDRIKSGIRSYLLKTDKAIASLDIEGGWHR